ncbi:hypothetical protein ACI2OX_13720 [Bacillus sp. N9]
MKDSKRFYPNGIFASHLIGYAQKNNRKESHRRLSEKWVWKKL